jgi:hypothetical protein
MKGEQLPYSVFERNDFELTEKKYNSEDIFVFVIDAFSLKIHFCILTVNNATVLVNR